MVSAATIVTVTRTDVNGVRYCGDSVIALSSENDAIIMFFGVRYYWKMTPNIGGFFLTNVQKDMIGRYYGKEIGGTVSLEVFSFRY